MSFCKIWMQLNGTNEAREGFFQVARVARELTASPIPQHISEIIVRSCKPRFQFESPPVTGDGLLCSVLLAEGVTKVVVGHSKIRPQYQGLPEASLRFLISFLLPICDTEQVVSFRASRSDLQ